MKAIEFIKKFGCEYTVDLLKNYPSHTHTTDDGRMFFNENTCANEIKVQLIELVKFCDLKKYTDAYELVQRFGGLGRVSSVIKGKHIGYTHFYLSGNGRYVFLDHYNDFIPDYACHIGMFNKTIALVAEVENYNEKTKEGDPS